jgi:hypothetical protein
MFTALYFKEWREKALLFSFELGILILLLLAQPIFHQKRDIQEWTAYAVLLLFFPFAALLLGAAGFESEYRQGAWAYLFSRPVRKPVIWLAKFAALLSMLAALWLIFLAAWVALPGVRELVSGTRILLGFTVESGLPWWSLWQSVFLLTLAFSLSLLHERQFNILFLALLVGLGLTAAAWAVLSSKAGGFLAWVAPPKALSIFLISQVLVALAFAAASVMTLVKSDFSQTRKQMLSFVRWVMPFLFLAIIGTAAWALLAPLRGEHYLSYLDSTGGEPYYITERGVFKYSAAANRILWLAKAKHINYFIASASGGKVAYTAFNIESRNDIAEELWVANTDGTGRKRIIGRGPRENEWPREVPIADLMMSPDGTKVAILSAHAYISQRPRERPPLWIANTDGSRLESFPDDPALFGDSAERYYHHLVTWAQDGKAVLIEKRPYGKPKAFSLWLYDLGSRTARTLLDNAVTASWVSPVSPRGDCLAIKYQKSPEKPWRLALLDLKSLETTDLSKGEDRVWSQISWDKQGDRMAYVAREAQTGGPDVYVLAVYSVAAKKTVAEKPMTTSESSALLFWPSWTANGEKLLVLDRVANGLRVFGPDLREQGQVAFPAWMNTPAGLQVAGDQALVEDDKTDSLWRFDLGKKRWKKLY